MDSEGWRLCDALEDGPRYDWMTFTDLAELRQFGVETNRATSD